jgi:membrane protein DedA with SNARE-associated domain
MMESLLANFSEMGRYATYAIIFGGMFIEGETFLILAGILVRGHAVDYVDTIAIALVAVIIHDVSYWYIGKRLSKTTREKFWCINVKKMEKFFAKLKKREGIYIFASKFAWGMNRFTLLSSGYFRTPLKKLLTYSIPAAFIWTTTFVSVGYMFADRVHLLKKDVKTFALGTAVFLAIVLTIEYFVSKSIKEEVEFPENGDR